MASKGLIINLRDKNLKVFRWAQEGKSESEGGNDKHFSEVLYRLLYMYFGKTKKKRNILKKIIILIKKLFNLIKIHIYTIFINS